MSDYSFDPSFDEVFYQIGDLLSGSDEDRALVSMSVSRLPDEVQDFVFENISFIIITEPSTMGGVFFDVPPKRDGSPATVVLCHFREEDPIEFRLSVIAHEIAHVFSGQKQWHQGLTSSFLSDEKEADALIKKWGFTPVYDWTTE